MGWVFEWLYKCCCNGFTRASEGLYKGVTGLYWNFTGGFDQRFVSVYNALIEAFKF